MPPQHKQDCCVAGEQHEGATVSPKLTSNIQQPKPYSTSSKHAAPCGKFGPIDDSVPRLTEVLQPSQAALITALSGSSLKQQLRVPV